MSYISVHVIAKETTKFGNMLLKAMLESIVFFPDQLVFVDNGCRNIDLEIFDVVCLNDFDYVSCDGNFSELRQEAIRHTNPKATHCFIIDTDEIFYENNLDKARENLEKIGNKPSHGSFKHFVESPSYMQEVLDRNNVFVYDKNISWNKGVHESLDVFDGKVVSNGSDWMHCGYLRSSIATAIKWIHYDMIEFGHADRYKEKGALMTRLGFDNVLADRKSRYTVYENRYPEAFYPILRQYEESDSLSWQHWVTYVVDPQYGELLDDFKQMAKISGWSSVIDYVIAHELWDEY